MRIFAIARHVTDSKRSHQELSHIAQHDWLTGLANRAALQQQAVSHVLARGVRHADTSVARDRGGRHTFAEHPVYLQVASQFCQHYPSTAEAV